jgi:hypothetical protein
MDLKTLTQEALISLYSDKDSQIAILEQQASEIKAELLKRQLDTGEKTFEANGWQSSLVKERLGENWLKRETGFEIKDLEPSLIKEKIVPDIDWDAVQQWLEAEGYIVHTGYTLRLAKKKVR